MQTLELRDPLLARQYLGQGLCWQRITPPNSERVAAILEWAQAIASEGEPLPALGFVADLGNIIFEAASVVVGESGPLPSTLMRAYEDDVLGKLFADSAFERAADALRPYQGRDRIKGFAFLVQQMRQRVGFPGVLLSPATVKLLRDADPEELLREGRQDIAENGPMPMLVEVYTQMILDFRNAPSVVGREDIFELERRTAIAQFGQRVALRQVLHASQVFDAVVPDRKPRAASRRQEIATRIPEEDTYPVGGFSSISTRGSIESLLHSQLAFMETDDRPDLFDIKFVRDELLYYSRDENRFLRRRRTFVFALYADLKQARYKDADLPYQRIILLLALLHSATKKLIDWLGTDSLVFEFFLIDDQGGTLGAEQDLLEVLFAEQIENSAVTIGSMAGTQLARHCELRARRSMCHCLLASAQEERLNVEHGLVSRFVLGSPTPSLGIGPDPLLRCSADSAMLAWSATLERLLVHWI
jgi:hypothetical protein